MCDILRVHRRIQRSGQWFELVTASYRDYNIAVLGLFGDSETWLPRPIAARSNPPQCTGLDNNICDACGDLQMRTRFGGSQSSQLQEAAETCNDELTAIVVD